MALTRWPLLLLTLGLGLAGAQETLEEVPLQQDFDVQKAEGHWITLQLAATHPGLVSPDDPLRLSLHSIRATDQGDLDFLLFWMGQGVCQGLDVIVHPTRLRGQYQGTFEAVGRVLVRVVGTNYESLLLHVRVEQDAETNALWALLARTAPGDPEWLGRFQAYVQQFHLEKVPIFNGDGQCPPPDTRVRP
ncbi:beta-lactoglobulin [Tenrec ecaudatus]|uniref:beta-lactoglobulin n=1 Tax=Tenrec ecaudatus TaxID=94439 RepID=UPI003F59B6F1